MSGSAFAGRSGLGKKDTCGNAVMEESVTIRNSI